MSLVTTWSVSDSDMNNRCSVIVVIELVERSVLPLLGELEVEAAAPKADNRGAVEVEARGKLHQAVGLV